MIFRGALPRLLNDYFKEHLMVTGSDFLFWILFFISLTKAAPQTIVFMFQESVIASEQHSVDFLLRRFFGDSKQLKY